MGQTLTNDIWGTAARPSEETEAGLASPKLGISPPASSRSPDAVHLCLLEDLVKFSETPITSDVADPKPQPGGVLSRTLLRGKISRRQSNERVTLQDEFVVCLGSVFET